MAIRVKSPARAPQPVPDDDEEESAEEFEERVYSALMKIARQSSSKLRSALGACVMMGTKYERAPEIVREAIGQFVEEADL